MAVPLKGVQVSPFFKDHFQASLDPPSLTGFRFFYLDFYLSICLLREQWLSG